MNAGTLKITTPGDREVVMTRVFDAPRHLVFDAFTRPELLTLWLDAPGRTFAVCDIDLRAGGSFRYVWRGAGRKDVGMRGAFREVVAPARFVHTESWEDWDAGESLVTNTFEETAGRTTFTSAIVFPSREVRDAVMKAGLAHNATATYEKLAEVLTSREALAS
jgi:uncharacterized protein YndB with AHSA1/START domain